MTRAWVLVGLGITFWGGPARASSFSAASSARTRGDECPDGGRGSGPLAELRESDLELSAALRRRVPDWSPEAEIYAARIARLLGEILDYESIAKQALGKHWDTLTAAQRMAFLALFSPLTNRAFVSAFEQRISVDYQSESISGSGAEATVIVAPRFADGAAHSVAPIEYRLGQRCGRWKIHDVSIDGVSLIDSYRAQFDRLFRRGTFDDLLTLMRRKLSRTEIR
jgi:phospholipid transport system substrate-binding protein